MLLKVNELNGFIDDPNLIVLDVSKHFNKDKFCIKGARYFNLGDNFSDSNSLYPNTFPSTSQFEEESQKLGINNHSKIVVYDNNGVFNGPRVWFMYKTMGHNEIYVLDGGMQEWMECGFDTDKLDPNKSYLRGNFKANLSDERIKNFEFINTNIKKICLIDARSELRFKGLAPEPRKGISSGSIPSSINIPYTEVLHENTFKSEEELKLIFKPILSEDKELVFSCGSGVTACILLFAFNLINSKQTAIYDGSWTEWATLKKI